MYIRFKIFVLILSLFFYSVKAQKFTSLQLDRITTEVIRLLKNFEKYSNLQPDAMKNQETRNEFLRLFNNQSLLTNFIAPDVSSPQVIIPADYYVFLYSNFTSGLLLKLSCNYNKISYPATPNESIDIYCVFVPAEIKAIGLYGNTEIVNVSATYFFVFEFKLSNNVVTDFVIHSVQNEKPDLKQFVQYKNSACISLIPANSSIYSKNIFTSEDWDSYGKFGYKLSINFIRKLNNNFGLTAGIGLSNYSTVYKLSDFSNQKINNIERVDKDRDSYFAYVEADVDEKNHITYIDLPMGLKYQTREDRIGFIAHVGINLSYMISSGFETKGRSTLQGYYPEYHVVLYDLPDYEFTTDEPFSISEEWQLNTFNVSAYFSAGIQIPLNQKYALVIAPYFITGLTDLGYTKSRYRDDYVNISGDPGKLTTRSIGLMIELIMNL